MNNRRVCMYGICYCLGLLAMSIPTWSVWAHTPDRPETWVDRDHFPEAYSILTSQRVMFPDNVSDWPLKIDSTRQLFVDDFLISRVEHLKRQFHQPIKYAGNPLMPGGYVAVLYDEDASRFRMWVGSGLDYTSTDGIQWIRSDSEMPGAPLHRDGGQLRGFIYHPELPEQEGRYKAVMERRYHQEANEPGGFYLYHSRDGQNWEGHPKRPILQRTQNMMQPSEFTPMGTGRPEEFRWDGADFFQANGVGDTSTFRYDPVLRRYVFDGKFNLYLTPEKIRQLDLGMDHKTRLRLRTFSESEDLIHWSPPRFLMFPDRLDPRDRQIYAHVGFVYESMWLGIIQAMRIEATGWKQTDLHLSYSRDGRHWLRPQQREPLIPLGDPDSWDADYGVSAYTAPALVGDELFFYYSSARNPARDKDPEGRWPMHLGLAKLRRDGFTSLNAGETPGWVLTRPLTFRGNTLFLNADIQEGGWIKAAVLSRDAEPIVGYTLDDAIALTRGTTQGRMVWKSKEELDPPDDDHVRILLQLKDTRLYSFWIE